MHLEPGELHKAPCQRGISSSGSPTFTISFHSPGNYKSLFVYGRHISPTDGQLLYWDGSINSNPWSVSARASFSSYVAKWDNAWNWVQPSCHLSYWPVGLNTWSLTLTASWGTGGKKSLYEVLQLQQNVVFSLKFPIRSCALDLRKPAFGEQEMRQSPSDSGWKKLSYSIDERMQFCKQRADRIDLWGHKVRGRCSCWGCRRGRPSSCRVRGVAGGGLPRLDHRWAGVRACSSCLHPVNGAAGCEQEEEILPSCCWHGVLCTSTLLLGSAEVLRFTCAVML